jgi:hypothetical protein
MEGFKGLSAASTYLRDHPIPTRISIAREEAITVKVSNQISHVGDRDIGRCEALN